MRREISGVSMAATVSGGPSDFNATPLVLAEYGVRHVSGLVG